jgi:hypothetical protein
MCDLVSHILRGISIETPLVANKTSRGEPACPPAAIQLSPGNAAATDQDKQAGGQGDYHEHAERHTRNEISIFDMFVL